VYDQDKVENLQKPYRLDSYKILEKSWCTRILVCEYNEFWN